MAIDSVAASIWAYQARIGQFSRRTNVCLGWIAKGPVAPIGMQEQTLPEAT